ncbi:hypothetical protein JCM3770_001419 [Rhodotorula araucariae]
MVTLSVSSKSCPGVTSPRPLSPLTFSTGASTDDDGVPKTPPDTHFLHQRPSSKAECRSPPPSTILEIALSNSSLTPFTYRPLSRSRSPPPSPLTSTSRQLRALPAGFEHIPWISSDDEDDGDDGLLSRSLSPPLHDFLSLPPLSPDHDDDQDLGPPRTAEQSKIREESDLPPSPPRTPSPRIVALPLPRNSNAVELPWASSSRERSSSPSPSRRTATRSCLPPLRTQLAPSRPATSPPPPPPPLSQSQSRSRSAPPSPKKPDLHTCLPLALSSAPASSGRRRSTTLAPPFPPASPRSRASLGLPLSALEPEPARGRAAGGAAGSSSERGRSRAARRAGEEGTSRMRCGEERAAVEAVSDSKARRRSEDKAKTTTTHAGPRAAVDPGDAVADDGGLQLSFPSEHGDAAPLDTGGDADDPHSLAFFENNTHSLPLLRLRHALSLAAVYAALPPSSSAVSSAAHRRDAPRLPSSGTYSASRSAAAMPVGTAAGNMVSQQYRLYAMGRAKAQRTGGVGYWEGGINAWELLLIE